MAVSLLVAVAIGCCSGCGCGLGGTEPAAAQGLPKPAPEPSPLPESAGAFAKVLEAYFAVAAALASDDAGRAKGAGSALEKAAAAMGGEQAAQVRAAANQIAGQSDLGKQRAAFERASAAAIAHVERAGNPLPAMVVVIRCPMAFDNRGARWLSRSERIENPYFGPAMLGCGSIVARHPPSVRKP